MTEGVLLVHRDCGVPSVYWPWDGVMSMADRMWHACPLCGVGLCSPFEKPMAHRECLDNYLGRIGE